MNSYDDLEDADRQDSNEQIDRSTLFQFKTPENSNELRYVWKKWDLSDVVGVESLCSWLKH